MPPRGSAAASVLADRNGEQVRTEQILLLYANAPLGAGIGFCVAAVLAYLQWAVIPHRIVAAWLAYMAAVSLARFVLARLFREAPDQNQPKWGSALSVGAFLAGSGWAAACYLLYPKTDFPHQVLLALLIGGMMLGAVSLLAPRLEVLLAFVIPAGLSVTTRFLTGENQAYPAVALLGVVFTVNIVTTGWSIYRTVERSLVLRFRNEELLERLQKANRETEILNQQLEMRVAERTSELHEANERLHREIDQRKQAEDELLRARKLESLGVLVGGIAHDFNNFLTVVQGNIDFARMELDPGNPVQQSLEQVAHACSRAAALASQLLTFSKGGAPVRRVSSARRLVEDAVSLARAGANVSIGVDIDENLWAADIDAEQTSHALHNILLNARQAMPEGGLIEVRAENFVAEEGAVSLSPGKYVRVAVRDYGSGIPGEVLPRIFDPYFTTKRSGSGLGLATAHAIVTKQSGHISVESMVGQGTEFDIYLPATEQAPSGDEPRAGAAASGGSGRILVMDDEEPLRRLLARVLTGAGYEVTCAADGAEAVAKFEEARAAGRSFEAVLLDLTVRGGMGGKDAAAKLREIDARACLIVSSGYSEAPVLAEFRKFGFDAALQKPWKPAELTHDLQKIIAERKARVARRSDA